MEVQQRVELTYADHGPVAVVKAFQVLLRRETRRLGMALDTAWHSTWLTASSPTRVWMSCLRGSQRWHDRGSVVELAGFASFLCDAYRRQVRLKLGAFVTPKTFTWRLAGGAMRPDIGHQPL